MRRLGVLKSCFTKVADRRQVVSDRIGESIELTGEPSKFTAWKSPRKHSLNSEAGNVHLLHQPHAKFLLNVPKGKEADTESGHNEGFSLTRMSYKSRKSDRSDREARIPHHHTPGILGRAAFSPEVWGERRLRSSGRSLGVTHLTRMSTHPGAISGSQGR
jgi:hypothetical protein